MYRPNQKAQYMFQIDQIEHMLLDVIFASY
jgi:hypothetical protein